MSEDKKAVKKTKGSPARKKAPKVKRVSVYDLYTGKENPVKVKDIDRSNGSKFRWTRTAATRAEKTGRFVRVGVAPSEPKGKKKESKSFNPPFVSVKKLDLLMADKPENEKYFDKNNVILVSLDLSQLRDLDEVEAKLEKDEELDWETTLPLYMVGTMSNVMEQLAIQKVLPEGEFGKDSALRKWVRANSVTVNGFEEWKKSEQYKDLVATADSSKKTKESLDEVDYEAVLRVIALSEALKKGIVSVLDVNGVELCEKFGDKPEKSVLNVFSDAVKKAIKKDGEVENYWETHIFNISSLKDVGFESVAIEEVPKKGDSDSMKKHELGDIANLQFVINGESWNLGGKIYSNNSKAVERLAKEIEAVNTKGNNIGYRYKGANNLSELHTAFESKLSGIQKRKLEKKKEVKEKVMDYESESE